VIPTGNPEDPIGPVAFQMVILDGSVALAWFFRDELDPYAEAVAARLPYLELVVPVIWSLEIANSLIVGERRRRSTREEAEEWRGYVASLRLTVESQTTDRVFSSILNLARTHNLSAYDASYLELALRLNLPLATLDRRLHAAAQTSGVTIFSP